MANDAWPELGQNLGVELDHVIWFVPSLELVAGRLGGFTLDAGMRHPGQGTRNRRVLFERNYLEILWIEDLEEAKSRGFGFEARCFGIGCDIGFVLRGEVASSDRYRYRDYQVAPDFSLLLFEESLARLEVPFLAVIPTAPQKLKTRWPAARTPPHQLNGAATLQQALVAIGRPTALSLLTLS